MGLKYGKAAYVAVFFWCSGVAGVEGRCRLSWYMMKKALKSVRGSVKGVLYLTLIEPTPPSSPIKSSYCLHMVKKH